MLFKDVPVGDLFAFQDEGNTYLKVAPRDYVHILYRSEFRDIPEDIMEKDCSLITLELLCVLLHRDEVIEWLHHMKAFYIPESKDDGPTTARLDDAQSEVSPE